MNGFRLGNGEIFVRAKIGDIIRLVVDGKIQIFRVSNEGNLVAIAEAQPVAVAS